ncbi:hypothetical protein CP973_39225 [Streptomyces albofaciens JCM 4342]|uniref:hypothetical protein n=1 Tax=Streptomyces albofaciens TaxID=66866 RepID=UPI001239AFA4|nr:hypothetical protein [Streptomyces albofaciens]KAA6215036.1 hypothetical protein CP973_39225 [Streptomyces albofaciens JCM 4342]
MSAPAPQVLAATVHVLDPVSREPLVLTAGTKVTDPAIAEQITNPACWADPPEAPDTPGRKAKTTQD